MQALELLLFGLSDTLQTLGIIFLIVGLPGIMIAIPGAIKEFRDALHSKPE